MYYAIIHWLYADYFLIPLVAHAQREENEQYK